MASDPTPTASDSFLSLLAEMEGCLDHLDPTTWTPEQREKIEARLFSLATQIAWKGQRAP